MIISFIVQAYISYGKLYGKNAGNLKTLYYKSDNFHNNILNFIFEG